MNDFSHVLVTAPFSPEGQETLRQAFAPAELHFCGPTDNDFIAAHIADCEVCILAWNLDDLILSGKKVQWVHSCIAGSENSAVPEVFERGIVLTNSAGRSAAALAEHTLMFMLGLNYDVPTLERMKAKHTWQVPERFQMGSLTGKTVGIIGLGQTGCAVARLCKAMGMTTIGWRRANVCPDNVDTLYSADNGDRVESLLAVSDFVVLCCELNDETRYMINAERLKAMKPGSFLINMGRGNLVDEPAMIAALQDGTLAGAGLDVFSAEPLGADSPLWDLPNVMMTPHATPRQSLQEERTLGYILTNLKAIRGEGEFVNRISPRSIYTK